jgi:DNA invertase Pin-like site-specific DNA recombinase
MKTSSTFAPLIRVSTERQEKRGESLHTQRTQLEQAIANMDGKVYEWYQGQEHATPDQERIILTKLIQDAQEKKFNAVVVCDVSRWSRDNGRSKQDLEILKQYGIRFFVREREFDLFDPMSSFMIGMSVEVGQYFASEQSYKSMINCIARAKKGIPTKGKLPYGRTFDRVKQQWGIDPAKQEKIKGAIDRYLAGGSMRIIGPSIGLGNTQMHYILSKSLGTEWSISFSSKKLNIYETVPFTIPALVDEATIKKVKTRLQENKNIRHGQLLNAYLLGRMIFCEKCGTALTGAQYHDHLYYRHQTLRGCKEAWSIRADQIEASVFFDLYQAFGDAVKSAEAIRNAIPDPMRRQALEDQLSLCQRDLAKNEQQRNNLIEAIAEKTITKLEAKEKMDQIRETLGVLLTEAGRIEGHLASIPSKEMIGKKAQLLKRMAIDYFQSYAHLQEMTFDDQRALLQNLFSGKTNDGKRFGVYISRDNKTQRFIYTIKGDFGVFIGYLDIKLNLAGKNHPGCGPDARYPRPRPHHHRRKPLFQLPRRGADALISEGFVGTRVTKNGDHA